MERSAANKGLVQTGAPFHGALNCPDTGPREATEIPSNASSLPEMSRKAKGTQSRDEKRREEKLGIQEASASVDRYGKAWIG